MVDVRQGPTAVAVIHAVFGPCSTVRDFLLDYLGGKLPWWRRWRLHMRACSPCPAYLERHNSSV